jgi:RecA/RadA recombinase
MFEGPTQTQEPLTGKNFSMFENEKFENMYIRSISKELDEYFEGGLHKGIVTQVYGESGCGKSQIAMLFTIGVIYRII